MSAHSRGLDPLDWDTLVDEARRRRKAEGLTQREHAALAGVSVPTIAAFDRGERTLTLAKAFDILRVVGLLRDGPEGGAQNAFVQDAMTRWRALVADLPAGAPARFPYGWYRFDYALEGDLRPVSLTEYEALLREAVQPHTGWPLFRAQTRPEAAPREVDGVVECWLAGPDPLKTFDDAAHADFWRAAPGGRLVLIRGYQEDGQETFPPASIFDTTLPIWRLGEALLHAGTLASLLRRRAETPVSVQFRAVYAGLTGRVLRAWANPLGDLLLEGHAARSDEAVLETTIPADDIAPRLADHLHPLIASLYDRFGVTGLTVERVRAETEKLLKRRRA